MAISFRNSITAILLVALCFYFGVSNLQAQDNEIDLPGKAEFFSPRSAREAVLSKTQGPAIGDSIFFKNAESHGSSFIKTILQAGGLTTEDGPVLELNETTTLTDMAALLHRLSVKTRWDDEFDNLLLAHTGYTKRREQVHYPIQQLSATRYIHEVQEPEFKLGQLFTTGQPWTLKTKHYYSGFPYSENYLGTLGSIEMFDGSEYDRWWWKSAIRNPIRIGVFRDKASGVVKNIGVIVGDRRLRTDFQRIIELPSPDETNLEAYLLLESGLEAGGWQRRGIEVSPGNFLNERSARRYGIDEAFNAFSARWPFFERTALWQSKHITAEERSHILKQLRDFDPSPYEADAPVTISRNKRLLEIFESASPRKSALEIIGLTQNDNPELENIALLKDVVIELAKANAEKLSTDRGATEYVDGLLRSEIEAANIPKQQKNIILTVEKSFDNERFRMRMWKSLRIGLGLLDVIDREQTSREIARFAEQGDIYSAHLAMVEQLTSEIPIVGLTSSVVAPLVADASVDVYARTGNQIAWWMWDNGYSPIRPRFERNQFANGVPRPKVNFEPGPPPVLTPVPEDSGRPDNSPAVSPQPTVPPRLNGTPTPQPNNPNLAPLPQPPAIASPVAGPVPAVPLAIPADLPPPMFRQR